MEKKGKKIKILDKEIEESKIKGVLLDVIEKRGLNAHLMIENVDELKKRIDELQRKGYEYSDYGNIYKYAFF